MQDVQKPANPLVSVVIPLFNGEAFIAECLASVYAQTYAPTEVLVVDDGSNDNSVAIVEAFPGEKKIIRQRNGEVSRARNTGITNANGEFVAFLDQDDLWLPDKISRQVAMFLRADPIDVVFTNLLKLYPSGQRRLQKDKHALALALTDENLFATLALKNLLMPSAVMVRRQSIIAAGLFAEEFKTCGDYEMWLRMAALGMRFRYLPEALTLYRQHGKNTSKSTATMHHDRLLAITRTFANPALVPQHQKIGPRALAAAYALGAHTFFSSKAYDQFLANARQAIGLDWRVLNLKMITRLLRSWLYLQLRKK